MVSVRREVIGKRVAKSTYSPFMMADEVAFVRWLVREGCQKFGWRDATWAGSDKSAGEGGNQYQKKRWDQKERWCSGGDSQVEDFAEAEVVDRSCFGCHLVAVEDWT